MTKDVIISISGLQYEAGGEQPTPVEIISAADYYLKNDTHYIIYDEVSEEFDGTTKNRIKVKNDCIEITKKGLTTVTMRFEKDKKNQTFYQTPFGSIFIGIHTHSIEYEESDSKLSIDISYELEVDGALLVDCKIQIKIVPKELADIA